MYKIVGDDQKEYGPVTAAQIHEWIAQGRANGHTMVKEDGATDWRPLGSLPEFYAALNPVPALPPAPMTGVLKAASGTASNAAATPAPAAPEVTIPGPPRTNPLAIIGLVMGILSLAFSWICCCWPIFSPLGIIFSSIALSQINKRPLEEEGRGLAIAGLVLSVLGVVIGLLAGIFITLLGSSGHAQEVFGR
jgi:hypothetical protein